MPPLEQLRLCASIDASCDPTGAKIRHCQSEKFPVMLVLGKREIAENRVAVRSRQNGNEGAMSSDEFFASRASALEPSTESNRP